MRARHRCRLSMTSAGLTAYYVAAILFFHNSFLGDLRFAAVLFSGFALLETHCTLRQEKRNVSPFAH